MSEARIAVLQTDPDAFGARLAEVADVNLGDVDASAALCFDEEALRVAAEAGIAHRFAIVPGFGSFAGSARLATACFTAHDRLPAPEGAPAHVVGPIAPAGFAIAADVAEQRSGEKLEGAVILVPGRLAVDAGMSFLLQLSLVSAPVSWLFDVGHDPELADVLRRSVPVHDLNAAIFARAGDEAAFWPLAHAALARAESFEAVAALTVGAGVITVPGSSSAAARALDSSGVGTPCDAWGTLAVAIDTALGRVDVAAQAARDLDVAGSAGRAIELARRLAKTPAKPPVPRGLPVGLERLARDPDAPPSSKGTEPKSSKDDDLESQIDAELAALRKKIR